MTTMAQKLTYAEKAILTHPKAKSPGWSGKYKRALRAARAQGITQLRAGSRGLRKFDPVMRRGK